MQRTMMLCACAAALAGCAAESGRSAFGVVEGGAYVGIVAETDSFVAYVCDGDAVAVWIEGEVVDGAFAEETELGAIEGVVAPDFITGTFTIEGGSALAYEAEDVEGSTYGIWRADETIGGEDYIGGWVVAPDASQRGAVMDSTSTIVDTPTLSITDGTSNTIVGPFTAVHIVSPRDVVLR